MSPRSTVRVSRARWLIGSSWIRDSILLALLLLVLPVLLDEFRLRSIGGFLAFAILALSLDFVWGFGGIISFGQGAFFGLGAYSIALGLTTWHFPFASFIGIFAGIGISGLLALLLGWFIFHGRVGTFYVAVFTLALSVVFQQLALQFRGITGGYNGIIIPERVMPQSPVMAYYVMLAILFAVLLLLVGVVRSDFGRVLIAIRDNEERARFLGYDVARVQTWAFGLAGALAAVGGMAYASYVQLASPDLIGFGFSTAVLIWVAVGGRGSLVGAAIGALLVNVGSQELGARLLLYWQLVLG